MNISKRTWTLQGIQTQAVDPTASPRRSRSKECVEERWSVMRKSGMGRRRVGGIYPWMRDGKSKSIDLFFADRMIVDGRV